MLKDKAYQKEINNAMKQLILKDKQLALKDEQHTEELTKRDKELNNMKLRRVKLSDQKLLNKPWLASKNTCHDEYLLRGTKQGQN